MEKKIIIGEGRSLMVSDLLCECHGPLKLNEEQARVLLRVGANYDGYWTNSDLIKMIKEKAIPIFEQLHPGCVAVFAFDNSQNHNAKPPDGLCAKKLNLNDGGKNTPKLRDTIFNGSIQKMQHANGIQKGIKTILQERDLWKKELVLDCKDGCTGNNCCARKILASQPDFACERSWLQETVEQKGHQFILFPKFHCEFNFIEMFWGEGKKKTRAKCEFTFAALERNVPEALNSIPLTHIRKYARHCFRNMDAYRKGLSGIELEKALKKYKNHRTIPEGSLLI